MTLIFGKVIYAKSVGKMKKAMSNKFHIFTKGRKYISPTQADMLVGTSGCPAKWAFRYEQKIRPGRIPLAMLRGKYFDWLCGGGGRWRPTTRLDGLKVIEQRYMEYRPLLPAGTSQVAIEIDLEHRGWFVRGFIDLLPTDPDKPFVEMKLPASPWKRRKIAYNRMQIITYAQATGRPGEFHVSNMAEPGVQIFKEKDYLPRGKDQSQSWAAVRKDYIKAIKLIESDDRAPRPNVLCKGENEYSTWQCDYYDLCQAEIKAKEMRINDLSKVF